MSVTTIYPQSGDKPVDDHPLGYRGPTACHVARITYRQLDYWCRSALVVPTVHAAVGSGTQRLYSRDDVVRLAVVGALLGYGLTLPAVRTHLDAVLTGRTVDLSGGVGPLAWLTVDLEQLTRDVDERLPAPETLLNVKLTPVPDA
jgi:DNA-binding transcriptional MerR regulator